MNYQNPDEITVFAALRYLECGFHVQPLKPNSKELLHPNALPYTPDVLPLQPEKAQALAKDFYGNGIALWMGDLAGRFATLDFDDPAAYLAWSAANPALAVTATAKTPGGGYHVVLKFKRSTPRSGKSKHYVDIISDYWYIAAWPSVHPNGGIYQWLLTPWDKIVEINCAWYEWAEYTHGLDMGRIAWDVPDYDGNIDGRGGYDD